MKFALNYGYRLLDEDVLDDDDKADIQGDMDQFGAEMNELKDDAADQRKR